ncbi:MAG: transporter substrate-binding domain-containing protein [Acidobacteria bacterium]|nr:transporter substrate-binding domain-containing protein [Acidobacteriota bacterium]
MRRLLSLRSLLLPLLCAVLAPAAAWGAAPLFERLPAEVRTSGVLRFVGDSHPPYRILSDDRQLKEGVQFDFAQALEPVLGVRIRHYVVNSLSATLAGLEAGRYDVAMGPGVATPERQTRFDGVSYMITRPSFVFPLDRPARYQKVEDLCGRRISYVAGSVTERVTERVVQRCAQGGKPAALHVPLVDTNMTLIATQAGRADLAGMTLTAALHAVHVSEGRFGYFSDESGALGLDVLSLFVTKRSALAPVMRDAMQQLFDNGEYARIMARWGIAAVVVDAPRINVTRVAR